MFEGMEACVSYTLAWMIKVNLFFSFLSLSSGKPVDLSPSWRDKISYQASGYAQHVAVPFLVKQLDGLHVPRFAEDVKTPLGKVKYNLNNIRFSDVDIRTTNISLQSGHGVHMTTDQANFQIGADWAYKQNTWPHISDSGSCILSIRNLSLGLTFLINGDAGANTSTVNVNDCNLKIGILDVKFSGGASWLYNLFSSEISKDLKEQLEKQICKSTVNIIASKANNLLASLSGMIQTLKTMQ